jgi:hypothetical protein
MSSVRTVRDKLATCPTVGTPRGQMGATGLFSFIDLLPWCGM